MQRVFRERYESSIYLAHIRLLQGEYLGFQLPRADKTCLMMFIRSKLFEAASYIVADFYSQEWLFSLRWFEFKDVDYNQLKPHHFTAQTQTSPE